MYSNMCARAGPGGAERVTPYVTRLSCPVDYLAAGKTACSCAGGFAGEGDEGREQRCQPHTWSVVEWGRVVCLVRVVHTSRATLSRCLAALTSCPVPWADADHHRHDAATMNTFGGRGGCGKPATPTPPHAHWRWCMFSCAAKHTCHLARPWVCARWHVTRHECAVKRRLSYAHGGVVRASARRGAALPW